MGIKQTKNMKPVSFVRTSLNKGKSTHEGGDEVVCAACRYVLEENADYAVPNRYKNALSLDALFIQHPAATYFIEVGGSEGPVKIEENKFLGVTQGDILTVDRALTPVLGNLVLAVYEGAFSLCRYTEHKGKQFLVCGVGSKVKQEICDGDGVYIWGVVSALSRRL